MSEENTQKEESTQEENEEKAEETPQNEERTFSQKELDEKVQSRLARERKKYADYEDLKAKAAKFDEMEEANKSELQKATERAENAEKKVAEFEKEKERSEWAKKASKETGVDSSLIRGATYEEMLEHAQAIAKATRNYPDVKDEGKPASDVKHDEAQEDRLRKAAGLKVKE